MAPRGRPSRVGNTRMDAAIAALVPMGFSQNLIRKKVKYLLKVYGGPEGWAFIEEACYKVVIDSILEDQESENCAPGEPKLLEDQGWERPGQASFEDSLSDSRAQGVDEEPSQAGPLCLTDRPSCSEQGAALSSPQTVAGLLIDSMLEEQESEKCAPGKRNSLDYQDVEKPGETSFEDQQSGTRALEMDEEPSEGRPICVTGRPSWSEQDAAHFSPTTVPKLPCLPPTQTRSSASYKDSPEIDMQDVQWQIAAILETFEHSAPLGFENLPQQEEPATSKFKRRPCLGWIGSKDNDDFVLLKPLTVTGEEERRRDRGIPYSRWDVKPDDVL